MAGHRRRRHLRPTNERGDARVHVTIHSRSDRSSDRRPTTRMATEDDATQIPQIAFPDNETFVASDVDFAALFPTAPPRFNSVRRFSCTRCQLAQVPTMLFGLPTLADVNLSGNALNDVPVQFEGSAITTLNLADNEFADVPAEVWAMPQLQTLDLSQNRVAACVSPTSDATGKAVAEGDLQTLILDNNPIQTFTCQFPKLQTLSLHNTSLTALPRALNDFSRLQQLIVSANPALDLASNESLTLANLEKLDLSSNELSTLPAELRILAPNVVTLTLASNNISDTENALAVAKALPNLTTIVLDNNNIHNVVDLLSQFPRVTNLSLASNGITEIASTAPVDSLRFLNLSRNAINSFNLTLPHLETLDLSNNSLSSVSSAIFALGSLRVLDVSGNPIEPLELTPAQFTFLSGLQTLAIDQTAFASCAVQDQRQLRGKLTVCVSPAAVSTPSQTTASPTSNPPDASSNDSRSSTGDQLLYLGGSFLIAILIALWIFSVRRRRARAAEAASASGGSPSVPGRASFSLRSPNHGVSSSSRPVSSDPVKSGRSGSHVSGQSGRSPAAYDTVPLSAQNVARAASNQSTFWEDEELQAWRVEFDGVKTQTKIAVGVFTEVWRASYRTDTVAVKKLKTSLRVLHQHHPEMLETGVLDDFIFEIRVLSRLNHPRIVAFYGAAWTSESELTAIMEYMPQQDLRGFLDQRRNAQRPSNASRSGETTAWSVEMVHMALCVAEALTCLHSQEPPIVHGNVQAKNVLLDEHMDSKLCDFGNAQYCSIPLLSFSDRCLTSESDEASSSFSLASVRADATPWISPEVLRSQAVCDPSIDMYAFGVLLSEIDTNEVPYTGASEAAALNDLEVRHQVAVGSLRPTFTSTCPLSILALATRCLAFEPQDRPTSTDVTFALREIVVEMERQSHASVSTQEARSTVGPLLNLQSTDSSVSDSDMSQRTIEFRRYSST